MTSDYFQVPVARAPHREPAADRPSVPILVVDDDEMKRFALKRLLVPLGYTVVEADSGRAALRCALAQEFAVILLDVRMPGMDGFETAALLRTRTNSELTPILLSTASTRGEITASGLYGDSVTHFMLAPVELDELRATIAVFADLYVKAHEIITRSGEIEAEAGRWRLLTTAAPVGIFRADRRHRYTYTNPCWSEITGIPSADALGEDWRRIVSAEPDSPLAIKFSAETGRECGISLKLEMAVAGSEPRIVFLTAKPLPAIDDEPVGWVGTLTDLTEHPLTPTYR